MKPDYLSITMGVAVLCLALSLALRGLRRDRQRNWTAGSLWACFAAGLLMQGFAMHLKVEKNLYVIPGDYLLKSKLTPKAIVERECRMQLLSALLTGGASLGLAYLYRDAFRRSGSAQAARSRKGGQPCVRPEA
jgi:hypothetical protein